MAMLEINWKPGSRELRQFAAMWLVFFGLLGGYWYYRGGSPAVSLALTSAAAIVGVSGLLVPAIMRPIYVAWMVAAFPIGWTVSHLLLGTIFYLLITPLGLAMRLLGHDPMNRSFDPEALTYWRRRRPDEDRSSYFRQF